MTQARLVAQFIETGRPVDDRYSGQTLHVRPVEDGTDRVNKELDGAESTVAICPSHDVAMDWAAAHGAAQTVSHEARDPCTGARLLSRTCRCRPTTASGAGWTEPRSLSSTKLSASCGPLRFCSMC